MKEMVFQQKLLGKAYFLVKMTAPAMLWLVSSENWKTPLDFPVAWGQRYEGHQRPLGNAKAHRFISLDHNCQVLPSWNKGVTSLHFTVNPLGPKSDQSQLSPNNINA